MSSSFYAVFIFITVTDRERCQFFAVPLITIRRFDLLPVVCTPFLGAYRCNICISQIGNGMFKIFGIYCIRTISFGIVLIVGLAFGGLFSKSGDPLCQSVIACFNSCEVDRGAGIGDDRFFVFLFFLTFVDKVEVIRMCIQVCAVCHINSCIPVMQSLCRIRRTVFCTDICRTVYKLIQAVDRKRMDDRLSEIVLYACSLALTVADAEILSICRNADLIYIISVIVTVFQFVGIVSGR